jgi:lipopolysaccharide transport system permease protein
MSRLIIEAGRSERNYWRDLWRYRELFLTLAWRDLAVRYRQTVIGVAWALIRPVFPLVVFSMLFGRLGRFPSDGVPYPLFVFAAMLPWQFFASALSEAGGSLVENERLISKIYFPRLVVPASAVIVSLVDFLICAALLVGLLFWYRFIPSWQIVTLPAFVALAFFAALGPGLILTTLNVSFRDFRYVIPFIVQVGLYVSPVGFSSAVVPEPWRLLYSLNPMVGVIDGFRWAICGATALYWPGLLLSTLVTVGLLAVGVASFRKMERGFADVI